MAKNQHTSRRSLHFVNWHSAMHLEYAKFEFSESILTPKNQPKLPKFFFNELLIILSTFNKAITLDSRINVGVRLLIFGLFSSGYMLIKRGTFINFFIFYLLNIFFPFFPSPMYKKIKWSVILRGGYTYSRGYVYCFCQMFQGLRLLKGVRLFRILE